MSEQAKMLLKKAHAGAASARAKMKVIEARKKKEAGNYVLTKES